MPSISQLATGDAAAAPAPASASAAAAAAAATATARASDAVTRTSPAAASSPEAQPPSTPSSASPPSSATPPPASPRHGFLSRLGLPLRSRSRNVADFHIRPDEPHRTYSAGDHVRGAVVLTLIKPLRMTHLVVALHGFVRVVKDPAAAAKARGGVGSSGWPQYHGNGFASLFQDEQPLSGDGRLAPGRYEFGFDLVFPSNGLPSSIDFERGTISYMITATITRPTAIAPTTTCDRKITLVDRIDVGLLPPPQANRFFLEPRPKRTRRKKSTMALDKARVVTPETNDAGSEVDSLGPSVATEDSGRDQPVEPRSADLSDIRSDISGESAMSASTGMSRAEFVQLSQTGTGFTSAKQQQAYDKKTITATIELLRSGCLPGDTVSVRVIVQHIKRIKSINGVVVTLYRHGKIDVSPPPSKFGRGMTAEDLRRAQKDEVAPRTRTGLSGLSLSSTGTTSIFRKDLDQNMAPLIIDPVTMQTSVTISVKLPDDSFPTIRGVPGDMVTFKYHVEVIVDLGGRLSRHVEGGKAFRAGPLGSNSLEAGPNHAYGGGMRRGATIADTSQLRREEGLISLAMEVVVGTLDSSRNRNRTRPSSSSRTLHLMESDDEDVVRPDASSHEDTQHESPYRNGVLANNYFSTQQNDQRPFLPPPHPAGQNSFPSMPAQPEYSRINGYSEDTPAYIPPPQLPDQNSMSEKDRIRQAEARLLPSQPTAAGPSSPGEDSTVDGENTPRLPLLSPEMLPDDNAGEGPSAPTEDDIAMTEPAMSPVAEDKQERERQRLLAEASAPPEFPEDMQRRGRGAAPHDELPEAEPSAPVLNEDDEDNDYAGYGLGAGPSRSAARQGVEQLPAYER